MRSIKKFMSVVILLGIVTICFQNSFAHSGRTDSNGGHKDNKNVSGLGSYHYHHGYGPHLHPNGVCPYEEKQEAAVPPKEEKSEAAVPSIEDKQEVVAPSKQEKQEVASPEKEEKKEKAPAKEEKPEPKIIAVESVRIDSQNNLTIDINEILTLNVVVNPSDATNKNVTWTSSDTSVATVDNMGVITAISVGDTVITATADNGRKDSITLTVNEVIETKNNNSLQKSEDKKLSQQETETELPDSIVSQDSIDSKVNLSENKDEESDNLTAGLGLIGAAIAFILYNTIKKKKK